MRWLACAALLWAGCAARTPGFDHCTPPPAGATLQEAIDRYPRLHDFCVVDAKDGQLLTHPQAVPFDVATPLFSDYAIKRRSVWMPAGAQAQYAVDAVFDFPVGTIFAKTFAFAPDLRTPDSGMKLVETRLLVRAASGWTSLPYVWNDAGTEAALEIGGRQIVESFVAPDGQPRQASYLVPQANQCGQCHDRQMVLEPIGPKARMLNGAYPYAGGAENQLDHWTRVGVLAGAPAADQAPRLPVWNDPSTGTVDERARAWLESNCAHCHSDDGTARTTGLVLWASETNSIRYGVCKRPVAAGKATGGRLFDIVPGKPDESILVYRIESTEQGVMMPEIGRSLVHAEGVALVREWIASLPGTCP